MEKGKGFTAEIKDGKMVIVVDLKSDLGLSKSGKSRLIATSGNRIMVDRYAVGLNVYTMYAKEG